MKKILLPAIAALIASSASAQLPEMLQISLADGTTVSYPVADIDEMTFVTPDPSDASLYAGAFKGTQTLTVGGMYTYSTEVTYTITAEADGTLSVSIPEYSLTNTMMGDLTLGSLTIKGLAYDEAKGGFYRLYANDGLKQHFKAVNGGNTTMDKDYDLGGSSNILITLSDKGIEVDNPFKLGAMPLPLTAAFSGEKL